MASALQMHGHRWFDKCQWTIAGHERVQKNVVLHHAKRSHTIESHSSRGDDFRCRLKARQTEIEISETRRCK